MGYTTKFTGELKFTSEISSRCLAKVQSFFGEDCRDHKEWKAEGSYIDLEFNKDFSGIQWDDETEKNNGMVSHVNLIINETKKEFPDFGLTGHLIAQGESFDDRWKLEIVDGVAVKKEIVMAVYKIKCPHCEEYFYLETE